jgi:hypothetical protein
VVPHSSRHPECSLQAASWVVMLATQGSDLPGSPAGLTPPSDPLHQAYSRRTRHRTHPSHGGSRCTTSLTPVSRSRAHTAPGHSSLTGRGGWPSTPRGPTRCRGRGGGAGVWPTCCTYPRLQDGCRAPGCSPSSGWGQAWHGECRRGRWRGLSPWVQAPPSCPCSRSRTASTPAAAATAAALISCPPLAYWQPPQEATQMRVQGVGWVGALLMIGRDSY